MRRNFTRFSILILTAFIGVSVYSLWSAFFFSAPQVNNEGVVIVETFPKAVGDCQGVNFQPNSDGNQIFIEADAYLIDDDIILWLNRICSQAALNEVLFITLQTKDFKGKNSDLRDFLKADKAKRPINEVEIRVYGTIKKSYEKQNRPEYLILPSSIEILSPYRKFTPKGAA
ncbi:MAG TPA: hypothetical protein VIL74_02095 [Pyrinomonadaceae bacterium]|jgi:hypothetical protein